MLLTGEAGIGKTSLLRWIAQEARNCGAAVLWGGAFQIDGMPPYLPLLEALGEYIRTADEDRVRQEAFPVAGALSVILPDLVERLGNITPAYELPPEQMRLRLFEATGTFIASIANTQPVVLVLDDLQWCDSSTLDLLSYVSHTQPAIRLIVVGAYREDEASTNVALQRAIIELVHQRRLTTVRVGALTRSDIDTLTQQSLGGVVEPATSELVLERCEGNPFYAEELLRHWVDIGALVEEEHHWFVSASVKRGPSQSIVAAVAQRASRLSPLVVNDLRICSIIGRTFDLMTLAAVVEEDPEVVEDRLSEATSASFITSLGNGSYSFCHDVIRECLQMEVADTRQQRLHQTIGLALEQKSRNTGERNLTDLAYHFSQAGDRTRGVAYALQEGDRALRCSAIEEALCAYETAFHLLGPDDAERGRIALLVADAALLAGKEELAGTRYALAQTLLTGNDPDGAGHAAYGMGMVHGRWNALPESRVALEAALSLLQPINSSTTVRVLVDLATLLAVNLGEQVEGMRRARQGLALARRLGDVRVEAAASRTVGNLHVRGNEIAKGTHLMRHGLVLARAANDPVEAAECCGCLANAAYWVADIEKSREYTNLRESFADRCQQPYELRHIHSWLAFLAATQGNWEQAEVLIGHARSVVARLSSSEPHAFLHQVEGYLAWEEKDYVRSARAFRAAMDIFQEQGSGELLWYLGLVGLSELEVGQRVEAEATLAHLDALLSTASEGILPTAPALNCAMLMAVEIGDRERAEHYYPKLQAFSGQLHWFLVDQSLAAFAMMTGDRETANMYLDRAEQSARHSFMASALSQIASHRARAVGDDKHVRSTAGLSSREIEVLGLVATGLTNREIGTQLYLSENTIAKHLTSILHKTDSENRAAAVAYAARHRLLE